MRFIKHLTCLFVALSLTAPAGAQKAPGAVKQPAATTAEPAPEARAALIDINSASKAELDVLPGIGSARAEAIIQGRPYKRKDDLVHKKIIPANVYKDIKDRIVAHQGSVR